MTPSKSLIVIGGGEFARVVIEAAQSADWNVIGFVDPEPCPETVTRLGVRRLGDDAALAAHPGAQLVLGVGTIAVSRIRERIVERIGAPAERYARIVHKAASVSPTARIEPGAVILPGAVVCTGAAISAHAIINIGAMVDHDVTIGRFVHVATGAALGGGSSVGDHAYIGIGGIVRDHVAVEPGTLVGMGAVVTRAHAGAAVLAGVPARPMG